jgi:transcription antitermination factor NusG
LCDLTEILAVNFPFDVLNSVKDNIEIKVSRDDDYNLDGTISIPYRQISEFTEKVNEVRKKITK